MATRTVHTLQRVDKAGPRSSSSSLTLSKSTEAESWQLENQYLLNYYRTISNSYRSSFHSLGYLHNETSNIYTHLFGAALFVSWAIQTYSDVLQRYSTSDFNDLLAFGVFFSCAIFCFGASALFHLFMNHSEGVSKVWLLLDYYGIFALIFATIFSGTYYAFYCDSFWWKFYSITVVTAASAVFCTVPRFRHRRWRNVRTALFITIGFYGCFPMAHAAERWGRPKVNEMFGWSWMFLEGMAYVSGALLYAFRIPERWKPGRFDIWGASHQIFHICAVLGAALHYQGLLRGFDYNHNPASKQC